MRQSALHHMSYDMEEQKQGERINEEHATGRLFLEKNDEERKETANICYGRFI